MRSKLRKIIGILVMCAAVMVCAVPDVTFAAGTSESISFPAGKTTSKDFTGEFTALLGEEHDYTITLPDSGRLTVSIDNEMNAGITYSLRPESSNLKSSEISGGTLISSKGSSKTFTFDLAANKASSSSASSGTASSSSASGFVLVLKRKVSDTSGIVNPPTGKFTLHLSYSPVSDPYETVANSNDTIDMVRKSAAIPFGKKVRGQLALNDTADVYRVRLTSPGRLKASFNLDLEGMDVWLYDGTNSDQRIAYDNAVMQGSTTLRYDLLAGDYYIAVRRHDNLGYNGTTISKPTGTYSFKLSFSAASQTYSDKDNTISQISKRKAIRLCTKIKGQLALNDDIDYYKLYIPKAGRYYIKTTSQTQRIQIDVYDSSKTLIRSTTREGKFTYNTALPKGTVYIAYSRAKNPDTGQYSFKVYPVGVRLATIRSSSGSLTAQWGKGTGSGYQLQYSTDRKFKKNVRTITIRRRSTVRKTVKGLRSGKTYYVRVRSYVRQGSKKYKSPWSPVKGVIVR